MNEIKIEKIIRESVIAIILSLVIIFLSVQTNLGILNVFSTLGLFLLGVPWIVMGIRNGILASGIGMAVLTGVVSFLFGSWVGIMGLVLFGPMVLVVQFLINKKRKISEIFIAASLMFFISIVILGVISSQTRGIEIKDDLSRLFQNNKEQILSTLEEQELSELDMSSLEATIDIFYKNMMAIMPTVMILISSIIGYLNYKVSTWVVHKMGNKKIEVPDFSTFALPKDIAIGIIMSYILIFILKSQNIDYHAGLAININGLLSVMFLVQGVSLISYFLKKKGIGKFIRIVFISFIINFSIIGNLILFAGMLDIIFDFRKIRKISL